MTNKDELQKLLNDVRHSCNRLHDFVARRKDDTNVQKRKKYRKILEQIETLVQLEEPRCIFHIKSDHPISLERFGPLPKASAELLVELIHSIARPEINARETVFVYVPQEEEG